MAFLIRRQETLGRPDTAAKVIKAVDVWAYQDTKRAIAEAVARRDQIIDAAHAAFEAEQRRGYREGQEAARLEQTGNMINIISQTVDYFARVEAQMVDLVMDAVRRIVSEFDERDRVVKVVRNTLALVRSQKHITVKVHPENISVMREQLDDLKNTYPGIEQIELIGDAQLATDACVIESDIGQVEASMSGQLDALRSTFSRVFGALRTDSGSGAIADLPMPAGPEH